MTWLRIGLWVSPQVQAGMCRDCLGVQPGLARISTGFTWCDDVYKRRLSISAIHVAQQEIPHFSSMTVAIHMEH